jgi:hypothetical protein
MLQEMFQNAPKQAFKPQPQPSTSGTYVSALLLSSPDNPDISLDNTLLLMLTQRTFTFKAEQIFCDF